MTLRGAANSERALREADRDLFFCEHCERVRKLLRHHLSVDEHLRVLETIQQFWRDITARKLREEHRGRQRAERELRLDREVCICGCPATAHESYGEDGESCEDETHQCIRVSYGVREILLQERAERKRLERSARCPCGDVRTCPSCGSVG